jgi:hypothetical protein
MPLRQGIFFRKKLLILRKITPEFVPEYQDSEFLQITNSGVHYPAEYKGCRADPEDLIAEISPSHGLSSMRHYPPPDPAKPRETRCGIRS